VKLWLKEALVSLYMKMPEGLQDRWRRKKITILLYHQISADLFESHLKFLTKRYNVISLERLRQALYRETNEELPPNPLVITFDDGWQSNYGLLPVIKKYQAPVTIFITTGLVGTCRKIWNYTLERQGQEKDLNTHLKNISNREKNSFLQKHNGYFPEKEYEDRDFLTLDEMKQMTPYVDFQSHGRFHPVFTMCSDEELLQEMIDSKKHIEDTFGHKCYAIAYPYGRHDQRVAELAQRAGYSLARVANKPALNGLYSDPFRLMAIGVDESASLSVLASLIAMAEVKTSWHY